MKKSFISIIIVVTVVFIILISGGIGYSIGLKAASGNTIYDYVNSEEWLNILNDETTWRLSTESSGYGYYEGTIKNTTGKDFLYLEIGLKMSNVSNQGISNEKEKYGVSKFWNVKADDEVFFTQVTYDNEDSEYEIAYVIAIPEKEEK